MRDLLELYDALDLMVGSAQRNAPHGDVEAARRTIDGVRSRGSTLGSSLRVALAGGTGTGKSSVLNAVAGERVASVSRLRPHTAKPLAWLPAESGVAVDLFLEDLGIQERRLHAAFPDLVLIDLPDADSVVAEHKAETLRILAGVDAILWVLDPEKYNDPALHGDLLTPLSPYADQTAFVLNKIDLIAPEELPDVMRGLKIRLQRAGYPEALVFPVAADPIEGEAVGIEPLKGFLGRRVDRKRVAYGKLLTDIAQAVRRIGVAGGVWEGAGAGLAERWEATREAAIGALRPEVTSPGEDALCRIEDLVAAVATEAGGELAGELRRSFDDEEVTRVMTMAQRAVAESDYGEARRVLDGTVGARMSELLAGRSRFAALVALAHVGARQLAHRYGASVR